MSNNEKITDEVGSFLDLATDDLSRAVNNLRAAMRLAVGCERMMATQVHREIVGAGNALDALRYARGEK